MNFQESIRVCLAKYADFTGRADRPEFWWFALFVTLAASALAYLSEALSAAFTVVMLLPLLAAGARRLHDTGQSAWWELLAPVPVGGIIVLIVMWAMPHTSPPSDHSVTDGSTQSDDSSAQSAEGNELLR